MTSFVRAATIFWVPASVEVDLPFRWDLRSPDNLGALLNGVRIPNMWYLDALVECTGKVLARSGNGDLFFVGRLNVSLDPWVWSYFGDHQDKLTRSSRPPFSLAEGPARGERVSGALAEPCLRSLIVELSGATANAA